MPSSNADLIDMLEEQVRALIEDGQFIKAKKTASEAVRQAKRRLERTDDAPTWSDLANALEIQGNVLRELDEHEAAIEAYDDALKAIDGSAREAERRARLHASRAVSSESNGDVDGAISHYQQSIVLFETLEPPAELDVADLSNNLAFLLKSQGEVDEAETLFLKALNISHNILGEKHEQTAALCNNLGALYIQCAYYDRSREMNMMALEARREIFGEHHPETAQSHANVAVALTYTNDDEWAEKHFRKAFDIFSDKAATHLEDLEVISANFSGFLRSKGRDEEADALEGRFDELKKRVG